MGFYYIMLSNPKTDSLYLSTFCLHFCTIRQDASICRNLQPTCDIETWEITRKQDTTRLQEQVDPRRRSCWPSRSAWVESLAVVMGPLTTTMEVVAVVADACARTRHGCARHRSRLSMRSDGSVHRNHRQCAPMRPHRSSRRCAPPFADGISRGTPRSCRWRLAHGDDASTESSTEAILEWTERMSLIVVFFNFFRWFWPNQSVMLVGLPSIQTAFSDLDCKSFQTWNLHVWDSKF